MRASYLCSFLDFQGENMEIIRLLAQILHLLNSPDPKVSFSASCLEVVQLLLEMGNLWKSRGPSGIVLQHPGIHLDAQRDRKKNHCQKQPKGVKT